MALVGGAMAMAGIYLDTAWHRTLGRDSFFSLPHTLVYGGGAVVALAAWTGIVAAATGDGSAFGGPRVVVGRFRAPFGFALTALGILVVLAAAPVDAFWHWMWGKDVLIWSPPHLQMAAGGDVTALGVLFAVAAQRGRGFFRSAGRWSAVMLLVLVDLVHRSHYVLAHYTMIPSTRTPDFYPFLAAMLFPPVLVAAAVAVGPWAATAAAALFIPVALLADLTLSIVDFERYTVSPIVAIPALAVTGVAVWFRRRSAVVPLGLLAGAAFALVFTAVEAVWMAVVVGAPWPPDRVVAGVPRSLLAGLASGGVGAVLGRFLRAVRCPSGIEGEFENRAAARRQALAAIVVVAVAVVWVYQPQRYGPPMSVDELRLVSVEAVKPQEAVFWEALLHDEWRQASRLAVRSEGVIDRIILPVGPAWCAPSLAALERELRHLRFALEVNGRAVDLSRYPIVQVRDRGGAHCAWVGVASTFQRASENRFVYTIDSADGVVSASGRKVVDVTVVFKDP